VRRAPYACKWHAHASDLQGPWGTLRGGYVRLRCGEELDPSQHDVRGTSEASEGGHAAWRVSRRATRRIKCVVPARAGACA
jgi:hypothetical protein